jgi:hypothetical protein
MIKQELLSKGVLINYLGEQLHYFEVLEFKDPAIKYGFTSSGWLINDNGHQTFVKFDSENYLPFVKILQIPFENVITSIENRCNLIQTQNVKIDDLFPIKNITKTAIRMESNYWSKLALKFLVHSKSDDLELKFFLSSNLNEKWLSQELKHLIKKYTGPTFIKKT